MINEQKNKSGNLERRIKGRIGCAVIAGVVGLLTYFPLHSYFASNGVVTTIRGTEVKRYDKQDKFLIFTDEGVFENTDAWYRLKFRSSDIQTEAMKLTGHKAKIHKYGWRIPLSSSYPNVVGIDEVSE
jgi:hypothetical protein